MNLLPLVCDIHGRLFQNISRSEGVSETFNLFFFLEYDPLVLDSDDYRKWLRGNNKAKFIIRLKLSYSHLDHVQHAHTAKEMWIMIIKKFYKHSLLNKLVSSRRFYTSTMKDNEKVLEFTSRIRQIAGTLKSMGTAVEEK